MDRWLSDWYGGGRRYVAHRPAMPCGSPASEMVRMRRWLHAWFGISRMPGMAHQMPGVG